MPLASEQEHTMSSQGVCVSSSSKAPSSTPLSSAFGKLRDHP